MKEVLLTVSGEIDHDIQGQINRGERPEADYIAMATAFGADLMDYRTARDRVGWLGRFLELLFGPNLLLAWSCFKERRNYQVLFTDGEQVGLPLAIFLKFLAPGTKVHHLMVTHILSVWKKAVLLDVFKLWTHIDIFFVYSTWQKNYIQNRWSIPEDKVVFTPFMVDSNFFSPEQVSGDVPVDIAGLKEPVICAVGLEFRDYPTLLEAIRDIDTTLIIAAASPWSKRSDSTHGQEIPENVIVRRFSQYELRYVYNSCQLVVMPLYNVNFQAGVTAILEAMAMGKPVVCTSTPGQTDVLAEGETGLYVPPEDPETMRAAITHLLAHPDEAFEMGGRARQQVLQSMNLERYTSRLNQYVHRIIHQPS